jgi:hypothetical protein
MGRFAAHQPDRHGAGRRGAGDHEQSERKNGVVSRFRPIRLTGKEEHLLSWPFLGDIPEAARVGNRQISNFLRHVQQILIARHEHIGLGG